MSDVGDIPALVRRLRSSRRLEQAQAAEALRNVAGPAAASVQAMLAGGAYAALVRLLGSTSNRTVQGAAARALNDGWCNAAQGSQMAALDQQVAATVAGSLPSLLALLDSSLPALFAALRYMARMPQLPSWQLAVWSRWSAACGRVPS